MELDFDLFIYNNLTNEVDIIRNFGFYFYNENNTAVELLYIHTKEFIQKQIPFRVEFVFSK